MNTVLMLIQIGGIAFLAWGGVLTLMCLAQGETDFPRTGPDGGTTPRRKGDDPRNGETGAECSREGAPRRPFFLQPL